MITNIQETLTEMALIYQWSDNTYEQYKLIIEKWANFNQMTFQELIMEAETDETKIHKTSKRTIKKRLIQYHVYLQQKNKKPNTIKSYISKIKKVYKYCDIEVPELPPIRNNIKETYEDIPTKDEIKKALLHSSIKIRALVTFIASSGLRRSDVAALKVGDFFKATTEYHDAHNVIEMIQQLEKRDTIIPEWHITSVKTGVQHITFSSHESTIYILQMLKEKILDNEILLTDSLFGIRKETITKHFQLINDRMGFGWKETRRKFHPHSMRKYFSTSLTNNDVDYLTTEFLVGHTLSSVDQSYYFANPRKLKNKYLRVMEHLTFTLDVSYIDVTSREKRELQELRAYRRESEERMKKLEEMVY